MLSAWYSVTLLSIVAVCGSRYLVESSQRVDAQRRPPETLAEVRQIIQRDFGGIFAASGEGLGRKISPLWVTGDFNGDGQIDTAILAVVDIDAFVRRLAEDPGWSIPGLRVRKVFYSTASRRELEKARMTLWDLAKSYQGGIILLIRHGVAPTRRQVGAERFALVGFCYYGDLVMTVSDKPLKAAAAGDSPVFPPPIIKGETLRFLDRKGEGMCVYWDGRQYSWYPIEPQD